MYSLLCTAHELQLVVTMLVVATRISQHRADRHAPNCYGMFIILTHKISV